MENNGFLFNITLIILIISSLELTKSAPQGANFLPSTTLERNQVEDPVVLWLNGGPGCSSLDGFVYEHGPFNFEKGKAPGSLPKLHLNPFSWSKVSNIIYLDSPAGVGFSYSGNVSDYVTGVKQTAYGSHTFLLKWFELYPEFLSNPFVIAGESYGGVYVPTLASEVVKGIDADVKPVINFKGYMVGNVVADRHCSICSWVGLISEDLYQAVVVECKVKYYDADTTSCNKKLDRIYFDDEVASTWLNRGEVRKAIHAEQESVAGKWELCTGRITFWNDVGPSFLDYHKNLTSRGIRALIYSGDHDMCVPFTGSEAWTRSLGYKIVDEWRPWVVNDQVAGYIQGYDKNLTFLTVKGCGHTVAEYKPREALVFYSRWLGGKDI